MLATFITIATLQTLGAGTMPAEPAALEQPFQASTTQIRTRAPGAAVVGDSPWVAGVHNYLQPNAGVRATRVVARPDYHQLPEMISRGTEP